MWQRAPSFAPTARNRNARHAWHGLGLNRKNNAHTMFQHCLARRLPREKLDFALESGVGGCGIGRSAFCGRRRNKFKKFILSFESETFFKTREPL